MRRLTRLTFWCSLALWAPVVFSAPSYDIRGEWVATGTCDRHCIFFVLDHVDTRAPQDLYFILQFSETQGVNGWPLTYVGGPKEDEWEIGFKGKKGALYQVGQTLVTPKGMVYKRHYNVIDFPDIDEQVIHRG